ncbi:FAD-dependent oxidoreductase [Geobacillus subterraneus]|uniref:FAD-dependent oxidoreductase n=1 Tax=Geobacillus subterraneus TaxID=129338 RepID=UPI0038F6C158
MRRHEVIVIGSGLAGLACAWELVRRRHRVLVLERDGAVADDISSCAGAFVDHYRRPRAMDQGERGSDSFPSLCRRQHNRLAA